jgi:hypothetical protein
MGRPALAALVVALACAATAAAASSPPYVSDCGKLVQYPKALTLACGDGNYGLAKLSWTHWGEATTTATGVAQANDCKPNCAAGHFHSYPARVAATKLTTCGAKHIYLRLTVDFLATRPSGYHKLDVWKYTCAQATHR